MKTILVTGIGGNVGQGILRCVQDAFPEIRLIGTNIEFYSAGNHFCDKTIKVPFSTDTSYLPAIHRIVSEEKVDLIIPSTDFETVELSKAADSLACKLASSPYKTTETYVDKYLSFQHHQQHEIPFADSYLPSEYEGQFSNCIVKPRLGRGSRGLHIDPADYKTFDDNEYLVQELATGTEFTTAFYVDCAGALHGTITLDRQLVNGATGKCRVSPQHDQMVRPVISKMINCSQFQGSANLQWILTTDGKIVPFEINCRISGTNSIRHHFGFRDVVYTIQECLLQRTPDPCEVKSGVAIRLLMDVISTGSNDYPKNDQEEEPTHVF